MEPVTLKPSSWLHLGAAGETPSWAAAISAAATQASGAHSGSRCRCRGPLPRPASRPSGGMTSPGLSVLQGPPKLSDCVGVVSGPQHPGAARVGREPRRVSRLGAGRGRVSPA